MAPNFTFYFYCPGDQQGANRQSTTRLQQRLFLLHVMFLHMNFMRDTMLMQYLRCIRPTLLLCYLQPMRHDQTLMDACHQLVNKETDRQDADCFGECQM